MLLFSSNLVIIFPQIENIPCCVHATVDTAPWTIAHEPYQDVRIFQNYPTLV